MSDNPAGHPPFPLDFSPKIGLLAGWGRFPLIVAETLKQQGYRVYCLGIKDHADPQLAELCDDYAEVGIARLGAQIRYFRRHGVTRATMAGKLHKVIMFRPLYWMKHLPDWRCLRTFYPHFITRTKDRSDDVILGTVVQAYAEDGITFAPATDFAPQLLVQEGTLAGRLTDAQRRDVDFGWKLAKEIGRLDIGQTVVVKGRAVLAVEAVEGTDECIRRAGQLCPAGGFTIVKVAKPQQDMRFDVPTFGTQTLETMIEAGARVLAVEAERTILLDQPQVEAMARRHGITIVAVNPPAVEHHREAA
ncbi:MAG: UDP-2,3-diacylglucosamine diphosphatase LpxI [Pirellulaceae bacterium]